MIRQNLFSNAWGRSDEPQLGKGATGAGLLVSARDRGFATVATGMTAKPHIFDFMRSRGARISCPFCGQEHWHGWDERITLDHAIGSGTVDRRGEAVPLTCANCGFIRLQAAEVLDDPRDRSRNTGSA